MAQHAVRMYREAYGLHACVGIFYNHESSRRGLNFVTQKIIDGVVRIKYGLLDKIELGNLDAQRDWGHARDFASCSWKILQLDEPEDFVVATGKSHSVRDFVLLSFMAVGIEVVFENQGLNEIGKIKSTGRVVVTVNPAFFRPVEPTISVGNPDKALAKLNWKPTISLAEMIAEMITACVASI